MGHCFAGVGDIFNRSQWRALHDNCKRHITSSALVTRGIAVGGVAYFKLVGFPRLKDTIKNQFVQDCDIPARLCSDLVRHQALPADLSIDQPTFLPRGQTPLRVGPAV